MRKKYNTLIIFSVVIFSLGIGLFFTINPAMLLMYDEVGSPPPSTVGTYVPPSIPTNPSIILNNGEPTTDKFGVTAILSCQNAKYMCFRLSFDSSWTAWESYNTLKSLVLPEHSVDYPEYRVAVKFKNSDGESEIVWDDIKYIEPEGDDTEPPIIPTDPLEPVDDEQVSGDSFDYTLVIILVSVIIVGIISVILVRRAFKKPKK